MQAGPAARLVRLQIAVRPLVYPLHAPVCTIGRSPLCHMVISHPAVSRLHARICRSGEAYVLEDSGSVNGTFVNGRRLSAACRLKHGDVIGLGKAIVLLRFEQPQSLDET